MYLNVFASTSPYFNPTVVNSIATSLITAAVHFFGIFCPLMCNVLSVCYSRVKCALMLHVFQPHGITLAHCC